MNERTPLVGYSDHRQYSDDELASLDDGDALHDEPSDHVQFDLSEINEEEESEDQLHRRHNRTESHGSVLEIAYDALVDTVETVQETVVEGLEEVQEIFEKDVAIPVKPREEGDHSSKLSALALAILVFYKVSGGPFGCEPTVKAGGPFFALLGFILFPIVWSVPEALVTAELGSAYPEPAGAIAWVEEAFGPKASLLCGFFHWISGATDNAIYPALFLSYLANYSSSGNFTPLIRYIFTVALTIILSFINYLGLEVVGNLSLVVCIVSMSPFVILCIVSIPKIEPSRWFIMPQSGIDIEDDDANGLLPDPFFDGVHWRLLLNNLFWNLNSFDVGASFAGEVKDPERVFPRAMFLSVAFVVLSYLLPLLAALGATDTRQGDWDAGYFTAVSIEIGGPWLGAWLIFASALSNIALFEAEMSGDAYQLMGMSDRGLIPKVFTRRSRFGTPVNGILLNTFVIIAISVAEFEELVEMLNFAYSLSYLMEFAAFVKLRYTHDDVDRPYKLPFGPVGCILFVTPPSLLLIYLILIASKVTYVYFALLTLVGLSFHLFQKIAKHYKLVEYLEAPKRVRRPKKDAAQPPL